MFRNKHSNACFWTLSNYSISHYSGKALIHFFIVHYCAENGCISLQWMVLCQPVFALAYLCRTESKKASTLWSRCINALIPGNQRFDNASPMQWCCFAPYLLTFKPIHYVKLQYHYAWQSHQQRRRQEGLWRNPVQRGDGLEQVCLTLPPTVVCTVVPTLPLSLPWL